MTGHTESLYIVFVCTGNICRSPMADVIFRDALDDAHLTDDVLVRSCGIGGWHVGQSADRRAIAELQASGHDGTQHRAAQLGPEHNDADLFVALDNGHIHDLVRHGVPSEKIRLLRSFDPSSPRGADVDDPYYSNAAAFAEVRAQIDAAMPGMIDWVKERLEHSSKR